ncbi:hypothetical protein AMECASPLE_023977 [Ameca splendens]|uniref:Uncharacterized protein n=1 Tax=Ameca splendens TaxID=208324 RepID=A0ABV0YFC7_9TELE
MWDVVLFYRFAPRSRRSKGHRKSERWKAARTGEDKGRWQWQVKPGPKERDESGRRNGKTQRKSLVTALSTGIPVPEGPLKNFLDQTNSSLSQTQINLIA